MERDNMMKLDGIRAVLFDLDGVLYVDDYVIDGAINTIRYVKEQQIPHRFVTNTTTQSREGLSQKLKFLGFSIEPDEILNTPAAARITLRQRQPRSCFFLVSEAVRDEFQEFATTETSPDVVVIGDIGRTWTYDLMNHLTESL
jgi:ribonucleotide monophosphatase NagD (HAD superfamily)